MLIIQSLICNSSIIAIWSVIMDNLNTDLPENVIRASKLAEIIDPVTRLECDGFMQCLSFLLDYCDIPYTVSAGGVSYEGQSLPLHFWVEVEGYVLEYRARMWFGASAPHGPLLPREVGLVYHPEKVQHTFTPIGRTLFEVLTGLSFAKLVTSEKIGVLDV
jgi:hypothetical protein